MRALLPVLLAVVAVVAIAAAPHPSAAMGVAGATVQVHHHRRGRGIELAFDDGPTAFTGRILDSLAARHATATFFVNGKNIVGNESLLERIIAEGHTVGNHAWSHRPLVELTPIGIANEIAMTDALVLGVTGIWPIDFRPPFVRWDDGNVIRIAEAMGHVCHVEPSFGDYAMSAPEIVAAAGARCGSPIWLHDGLEPTVDALPAILRAMPLGSRT